ncbi:LysR family transcriptional regulator [Chitinivorax sp. B]|uniref:LysR family transcriptional regulator n=1 Tax=Chitinivorax sp. B TaxID=2502235 RepID=UPI0010F66117|nr:LysR family transcriptional regulator [Chitinivorax sp. B]
MQNEQKLLAFRMLLFREVIKQGSFTDAALAVDLTKSGISQHVAYLEKQLGTQLLVRTTRRLSLTEAGRLFLARCNEMATLLDVACDEVQQLSQRPSGPIRVTAPHALTSSVLIPAMLKLTEQFPDLEPDIRVDDAISDIVRDGIDLALRVGVLPESTLRARKVGELWGIPVASPRYLATIPLIQHIQDLTKHPFIATRWQQSQKLLTLQDVNGTSTTLPIQPKFKVDNAVIACELAVQGKGIAILPNTLIQPMLQQGLLSIVLAGVQEANQPIFTVHSYQGDIPLAVRWLQTFLQQQLAN